MSSTRPSLESLPTGWLAPPPGLVPSNDPVKIQPIPIAITATLAFIVGAIVILFVTRKDKDVFLEDRISYAAAEVTRAGSATQNGNHMNRGRTAAEVPMIQHPLPSFTNPTGRRPGFHQAPPKATAMLGMGAHNWQHGYAEADEGPHAHNHKEYYDEPDYDSGEETLQDYEKDSNYWPALRSEANNGFEKEVMGDPLRPRSYQDGSIRRSPFGIASRSNLGDAY